MKLSTRGCYGLTAMTELARFYGGGPLLMRAISEKYDISRKYLHALLTSLKAAGLVRSIRGSGGGYILTRAPADIAVSEIIKALEGTLAPAECVQDSSVCTRSEECAAHELWVEMHNMVQDLLDGVSLADQLTRQVKRRQDPVMYHI